MTRERGAGVGLFRRAKDGLPAPGGGPKAMSREDLSHLEAFVSSRRGVEIYVEPATTVTPTTVALVAMDGEWTRRRVDSPRDAQALGRRFGIPVYEVAATGYPERMRQWTNARRAEEKARLRGEIGTEPSA